MTLWEAYRAANQRRAAVSVSLAPDQGIGTGRTERSLRVSAHLINGHVAVQHLINGHVAVQQGLTSDWYFVAREQAKTVQVERS